ncbi:MAG: C69 family dipeptidase [Sedimentisphaerales bacterium]|nr:C69 family dipeptidase [Sedimentisphaerales bacterium]
MDRLGMMEEKIVAKISLFIVTSLLILLAVLPAGLCDACFSIVVGKKASTDGYVIVAHNEDDGAPQIVNHHKVARKRHAPGEKVQLLNGGQLEQAGQTWAYIWSEMPEMHYSDSYINEWGVSVTSDNCPSREDRPDITDGGIGFKLRRLVAQRAKTAREGVLIAGKLVERFGYVDSGRTYIICDPDEGWLFCAVNGKHWLAQRVDDNEVAMVANTYTIRRVDLSNKDKFLASEDIIEYAQSRGWYNPKKDGPFDFAVVYANPQSASHPSNLGRQRSGLRYISSMPVPEDKPLPFSVVPRSKIDVAQIMTVLRHDFNGTKSQTTLAACDPYNNSCPICSGATQTSFVAQLRRGLPLDIGIVYWMCLASPRTSFYIPYHFGISDFPVGFSSKSERPSSRFYDDKVNAPFKSDLLDAFWTFSNFYYKVNDASPEMIARIRNRAEQIEKNACTIQRPLEEAARRVYAEDKATAIRMLENYSNGMYLSSLAAMEQIIDTIEGDS